MASLRLRAKNYIANTRLFISVKLRQPGVSTNIAVHKYFYERNPIWQQVVAEEKQAVSAAQAKDEEGGSEEDEEEEETKPFTPVHFDPIDSRHLSSMPVLKSRLTKLLKACPHSMHTSNNLMLKIVCSPCLRGVRNAEGLGVAGFREPN